MTKIESGGFTLIELLMAILIVSILAGVAVVQFVDYRAEALAATARQLAAALNVGINIQKSNMLLRCRAPVGTWPHVLDVNANDITNGNSYCTTADIPNVAERQFIVGSDGALPPNPISSPPNSTVLDCQNFGAAACAGGDVGGVPRSRAWFYAVSRIFSQIGPLPIASALGGSPPDDDDDDDDGDNDDGEAEVRAAPLRVMELPMGLPMDGVTTLPAERSGRTRNVRSQLKGAEFFLARFFIDLLAQFGMYVRVRWGA